MQDDSDPNMPQPQPRRLAEVLVRRNMRIRLVILDGELRLQALDLRTAANVRLGFIETPFPLHLDLDKEPASVWLERHAIDIAATQRAWLDHREESA